MNFIREAIPGLAHLFFPKICIGCGSDLISADQLLCLHCYNHLPLTHFSFHADNPVEKIFWGRVPVTAAGCQYYFTKDSVLQHILHQFKYKGKKQIGIYLGRIMGKTLFESGRFAGVEALVPLPLFADRQKKRGYNQAAVLCEGMAEAMDLPVLENMVKRISATDSQTKKSRIERWKNISNRFELNNKTALLNKHILLVDDVITTGATLEACANALLTVEGIRISIATLAFAAL